MAIPLLETCDMAERDITADALLTQRALADYLVSCHAHYHFTVKDNQKTLAADIRTHFARRGELDYAEPIQIPHGRIEQRRIWCTTALNDYLNFPHVGQAWLIERDRTHKKSGASSRETVVSITRRTSQQMTAQQLLAINRGHWSIESVHYIIDWNYDEDRGRIRTGHGPRATGHGPRASQCHTATPLRDRPAQDLPKTGATHRANDARTRASATPGAR
ncbi:MAG: ISAs1 family transposase [Rhodanobacter sp.]|nr:MAG: ISAs1 family transposase [Rhodanobacter sp.]TAM38790.1 MAG: ISAs1 family transposase [Rhodanobacter sp.]